tara:strand:+ start:354 stop:557 length:204 start_codon:yes stop_codon:yes gene_type:complete
MHYYPVIILTDSRTQHVVIIKYKIIRYLSLSLSKSLKEAVKPILLSFLLYYTTEFPIKEKWATQSFK